MAAKPIPHPDLELDTAKTPTEVIVRAKGRITSTSTELLKQTVRPLISESKHIVLDLSNVSYLDSSGLGTIVGLYVSAKRADCRLQLINLNDRLRDLFSITRLGEFLAEGRDPNYPIAP